MLWLAAIAPAAAAAAALAARDTCPDYNDFSKTPQHGAGDSAGPQHLPNMRPVPDCRTFHSDAIEQVLRDVGSQIASPDLRQMFTNALPNTLDTTVKWHQQSPPLSFIVTGDIDAMWIRDSHRQLSPYIQFAAEDAALQQLVNGTIQLQARFIKQYPYCNALQAPPESGLPALYNNADKNQVTPYPDPAVVFESKQELDSLASVFGLANEYHAATGDLSHLTPDFAAAVKAMFASLDDLRTPTFDPDTGKLNDLIHTYQGQTTVASETLYNWGRGNPVRDIGLYRSFFRPSDDASIFHLFVPGNAVLAVELERFARYYPDPQVAAHAHEIASQIRQAIWEHAVVEHPKYGRIFAYEIDGYGGHNLMDDANIPSLLALPDMGFVDVDNDVYQNTRRFVLSVDNPYYSNGEYFAGIGGPHEGLRNAWPLSRLVAARTSSNVGEIRDSLRAVLHSTQGIGLMHESVNVDSNEYTRPWFAWANSEFGKTILDLHHRGLLAQVGDVN